MSNSGLDEIAAVAARLFLTRGFKGVSQRAIANALGIRAPSLYHHCPGGKAELYARSVLWFLEGHEARLLAARGSAAFPESLIRMACHTLGGNHVDLRRIVTEDLSHLSEAQQSQVSERLHEALLGPFVREFEAAKADGKVRKRQDSGLAAACVLAIADNLGGLHLPKGGASTKKELEVAEGLVRAGISLLLEGTKP